MFVSNDGAQLTFVHDDDAAAALRGLGAVQTCRASHVEPAEDGWIVDLSPITGRRCRLGPFASRRLALRAEVAWLLRYLRGESPSVVD